MFANKLVNSFQARSGTGRRQKKRTTLREALRNRGGAALEAHYTDVADRLGLDEPVSYRSDIRRALQARGGMQRATAQEMGSAVASTPTTPSTVHGRNSLGNSDRSSNVSTYAESPCSDLSGDVTQEARGPPVQKRTFRVVRRCPPAPDVEEHDDSSTDSNFLDGWRGPHFAIPEPKASDVMQRRFRRCCSDVDESSEMDWSVDRAKRVKNLREFWSKASEVKMPTNSPKAAISKDEQSKAEAKALMEKILASGEKIDLEEERRLRKVISKFD